MAYTVALYSPDTHVAYDGDTPDQRGIGGGVTSRVRLLRALARLGHTATAYVNCERPGVYQGVTYRRFDEATQIESDILIAGTSGVPLDFSPLRKVRLEVRLRYVMVAGVSRLNGLDALKPDYYCVASNFMRGLLAATWDVPERQLFVNYRAVEEENFRAGERAAAARDPFGLVYLGHPSKGLDRALAVLRALRAHDPRYRLDVYGTHALWGQPEQPLPAEPGVAYRGLVAQPELARRLFGYTFCLALQSIPEAGAVAVHEARRAGVIVLASRVGVLGEIIHDGFDGFSIGDGTPGMAETEAAVEVILRLSTEPNYATYVSGQARAASRSWELAAATWVAHWDAHFAGGAPPSLPAADETLPLRYACPHCRVAPWHLADGLHCPACGRYFPPLDGMPSFAEQDGGYGEVSPAKLGQLLGAATAEPWREAVNHWPAVTPFLKRYIEQESRGYFYHLLELPAGAHVLDVGTGYGAVAVALARRGPVVALDNTLLRLAFLRQRRAQDQVDNLTLVHGDALALPFEPEQFDLVTLVGVLEWAGTMRAAPSPEELQQHLLREAYRALKPGGCVFIGIENRYGFKYLLGEPDDHTGVPGLTYLPREAADVKAQALLGKPYRVRTHGRAVYRDLLASAGFQHVDFYVPYPDYRLWHALVPLDPPELAAFYLDFLAPDQPASPRDQQVQALEWTASRLGHLADRVGAFALVGWK